MKSETEVKMPSLYGAVKSKTGEIFQDSLDYCKGALQSVSRSFALTIPLVEENILAPIMVGYLEARILDTFEDDIGRREISLQERINSMNALMEILESPGSESARKKAKELAESADELVLNPNYRDLVKNMERILTVHSSFDERTKECMVRWLKEMNFGMQKFLKQEVYSFEDLNEYCYYVAGTPSGFLTELVRTRSKDLDDEKAQILRKNERDFGLFLQKVNIIRDYREDILDNEKIFWPGFLFEKYKLEPADLLKPENEKDAMKILNAMMDNASQHIEPVKEYLNAIPEEYAGFRAGAAVNFAMGVATLDSIRNNAEVFLGDEPVKISHEARDTILSDPLGFVSG
jgi:farnesyl-diphosphate farnesyltransferase